jgi:hypothetical protein
VKRLPSSMLVPFLLAACAGSPAAAARAPAAAAPQRPLIANHEGTLPGPNPPLAHTEDLDEYHLRMLELAQTQFETFIRKAGNDPRFAETVKRSRDHIDDIEKTREFVATGPAGRR